METLLRRRGLDLRGATAGSGETIRIVVKLIVRPLRSVFRFLAALLPAGDLVMMRKQLRNLKSFAEEDFSGPGQSRGRSAPGR